MPRTISQMKYRLSQTTITLFLAFLLTACQPLSSTTPLVNNSKKNDPSTATVHTQQIWPRLSNSFQLRHYTYKPLVQKQIRWFQHNRHYLNKILNNSSPYLYYILQQIKKDKLPGELALVPIVESNYDPFAYSDRGAAGLWQLMPGTATGYGLKEDWWYDGRRDIYASTKVALDYLTYLQNFFNGNWVLALAAYDSGEGTVQQAIEWNVKHDYSIDFWNLRLPKETQSYVPRLLALAAIIQDPSYYGVRLPNVPDGPYFVVVDIGKQINLSKAAKYAGISLEQLTRLNPGYNRWSTDPNGPYRLLLPIKDAARFKSNFKDSTLKHHTKDLKHTVKPGESLYSIARKNHISIASLKKANHMKKSLIRSDEKLVIPRAKHRTIHHVTEQAVHARVQQERLGPIKIVHRVRKGDSFDSLSKHYHIKPVQIRFWNNMKPSHTLKAGEQIVLWIPRHKRLAKHTTHKKQTIHKHHVTKRKHRG